MRTVEGFIIADNLYPVILPLDIAITINFIRRIKAIYSINRLLA